MSVSDVTAASTEAPAELVASVKMKLSTCVPLGQFSTCAPLQVHLPAKALVSGEEDSGAPPHATMKAMDPVSTNRTIDEVDMVQAGKAPSVPGPRARNLSLHINEFTSDRHIPAGEPCPPQPSVPADGVLSGGRLHATAAHCSVATPLPYRGADRRRDQQGIGERTAFEANRVTTRDHGRAPEESAAL